MGRKVFQDFANVICQRFIEVPSNKDLINLTILGGGKLVLDITGRKATCNRYPVEPLPYSEDARIWLEAQMQKHGIPMSQLVGATLAVDYVVELSRRQDIPIMPIAKFNFNCTASIASPDRQYTSVLSAEKTWRLGTA